MEPINDTHNYIYMTGSCLPELDSHQQALAWPLKEKLHVQVSYFLGQEFALGALFVSSLPPVSHMSRSLFASAVFIFSWQSSAEQRQNHPRESVH